MIEEVIHELNCISRMALIENAPQTSRLSICAMRFLKYKYMEESREVVAYKEFEMAENLLELEHLKGNRSFTYQCTKTVDLNTCFLPHYSLLEKLEHVLSQCSEAGSKTHLELITKGEHQHVKIMLIVGGQECIEIPCR